MTEPSYIRTVVVGVDGTPEALVAARYAVWQAALEHADVLLVHSYPLPLFDAPTDGSFIASLSDAGQEILDEVVAGLDVPAGVQVSTLLAETLPVVLMQQLSHTARLMVVGQHAIAWYERVGRGSVASPLAHRSGCPVVVVPPTWHPDQDRRPVVVALDGEVAAPAALELAFAQAELLGTEVVALHAVPAGRRRGSDAVVERGIGELLSGVRADHPGTTVRVDTVRGDTRRVILEAARSAALLVVSPPHLDGPVAWTRSVARSVMAEVECPVVVVPRGPARLPAQPLVRPQVLVAP